MDTCAHPWLGCPRNNQILFSVRTETNQNSICFDCFSVCFAKPKIFFFRLFRFVSVFRTGIETTKTNRNNLSTTLSIRVFSKQLIFFFGSNRNKPKLNLFQLFFSLFFWRNPPKNVRFVLVFRTGIETTETNNLSYGELKRFIF